MISPRFVGIDSCIRNMTCIVYTSASDENELLLASEV
jgi:hypothetical protein